MIREAFAAGGHRCLLHASTEAEAPSYFLEGTCTDHLTAQRTFVLFGVN